MSSILCPKLSDKYARAFNNKEFFDSKGDLERIENFEIRESPYGFDPRRSCETNLFLGFFFDGTRNNYRADEQGNSQSNVARLYDIFPGFDVPKVLPEASKWKGEKDPRFPHFYRIYVPGVASPFEQVEDSGAGFTKILGGAGGREGEDRIVWALIQAINSVHRFFYRRPLLSYRESTDLAIRLSLGRIARGYMTKPELGLRDYMGYANIQPRMAFESLLKRLHASVSLHWPVAGGKPRKIDPGIVKTIHVSTFGFSRGATQARAFANWLDSLCRLDAMLCGRSGHSLGGFPVEFDFLGLFDSVASVGLGNTYGNALLTQLADGHGAWADAEDSLRIPASIKSCVHLVAGHELRRSFPLDSIAVGSTLPPRSEEVVFPGVHSDVGGGYGPMQQGKGVNPDGSDMLSRLPLLYMYRKARLAGVPLRLDLADEWAQKKFAIDARVLKDFNAYVSTCTKKSGSLTDIMREQQILQMEWRYARRDAGAAPLHTQMNFRRASNFDKNDLECANKEFNSELAEFEESLDAWKRHRPRKQAPGFGNSVPREWEEIATHWPFRQPDPAVARFFDEYVHDSRAAFKLGASDNPADAVKDLEKWSRELAMRKTLHQQSRISSRLGHIPGAPDYGMHPNHRMAAEAFERARRQAPGETDRSKFIPRYIVEGREPFFIAEAGYFRFRKIYGGSDDVLLSNWRPVETQQDRSYASLGDDAQANDDQFPSRAA
ncbi:T6SS phospholipase effector Tle1-like catalytic domain-containing protein [Massilia sp. DD77]|uniref:T6SS phospholipase effector Tle1-like catalytic domain-containing protein n=1 Tax=Massilia sp. DD77 TaxID=3109349 RepID=UPI002FFF9DC2